MDWMKLAMRSCVRVYSSSPLLLVSMISNMKDPISSMRENCESGFSW